QIYVTVLSMDMEHPAELPAFIASSAALYISKVPFTTPIGACRVSHIGNEFVLNPTFQEMEQSDLDLVAAGTKDAICMVESGSNEVSEDIIMEALRLAHAEIRRIVEIQEKMREECGKPKMEYQKRETDEILQAEVDKLFSPRLKDIHSALDKQERKDLQKRINTEIQEALTETYPEREKEIARYCEAIYTKDLRRMILEEKIRADGRGYEDIRPITCDIAPLPRTHGSAIFTRGQTQALATITLGTPDDRQTIDDLMGVTEKAFMLHYNFPSYSVGECRRPAGPGRREIGHGMLAERAIYPVIPENEKFPYTIRIVSEVLESNGSSSMASVCAGILALMDAGVPITNPVAGIAMGLFKEGDKSAIVSDILGLEDHLGDMDFKVAGTQKGITALQMDIKVAGITFDTFRDALDQAKRGREHILGKMLEYLPAPMPDLKPFAPRIQILHIPVEKIGELIGPGGKVVKEIIEKTGCKIDIENDGSVYIASTEATSMNKAIDMINAITAEAEIGKVYTGKVVRIATFGAFVEILPGKDGLVHISELDFSRVGKVEDVCREGDTMLVKVIGIDPINGKIKLSRKAAMKEKEISEPRKEQSRRGDSKAEFRWVPRDRDQDG
ncbi:polyribonucleotide nucleotidyltransferase, partial [Candidatus Sumerlaeota bacterium]|nr:polyribonucleotide nucleotidyltransferase [Candidatus Sumerlaeota bacterium]